jgi:hypothetical protein
MRRHGFRQVDRTRNIDYTKYNAQGHRTRFGSSASLDYNKKRTEMFRVHPLENFTMVLSRKGSHLPENIHRLWCKPIFGLWK